MFGNAKLKLATLSIFAPQKSASAAHENSPPILKANDKERRGERKTAESLHLATFAPTAEEDPGRAFVSQQTRKTDVCAFHFGSHHALVCIIYLFLCKQLMNRLFL